MLEILVLIALGTKMGKMLRAKGRKPHVMQITLVVMWIAGEFIAGFIAGILHALRNGQNADMGSVCTFSRSSALRLGLASRS